MIWYLIVFLAGFMAGFIVAAILASAGWADRQIEQMLNKKEKEQC